MKKINIFLMLLLLVAACTKEDKGLNVSVTGFVRLIDQEGYQVYDRNNVKVSLQGSTISTQTDQNGKFLFTGLEAGKEYGFDFSKDSFGTVSFSGYKFIGDAKPGLISNVTLYQIPQIELISATLSYSNNYIEINGKISQTNSFSIMAYANDSSNVSDSHYDYVSYSNYYQGTNFTTFFISIPVTNNTYPAGTVVYVGVYFHNFYENGYIDPKTNRAVHSSSVKAGTLQITL
jgi:hypothetical protein